MNARKAVAALARSGVLLVYPLDNRPEPPSLWSSFYPRTPMRWEWDDDGDDRVATLWHLRAELSGSGKVIYAKWFRGRATFFSREIFAAFLRLLRDGGRPAPEGGRFATERARLAGLSEDAQRILSALELDSPLSTKQLKAAVDLRGREYESRYERALKELWSRLLIVGYGEVDDGAFPSLAIGATHILFEDLWNEAAELTRDEAWERVSARLPENSLFLKQLQRGRELDKQKTVTEPKP